MPSPRQEKANLAAQAAEAVEGRARQAEAHAEVVFERLEKVLQSTSVVGRLHVELDQAWQAVLQVSAIISF